MIVVVGGLLPLIPRDAKLDKVNNQGPVPNPVAKLESAAEDALAQQEEEEEKKALERMGVIPESSSSKVAYGGSQLTEPPIVQPNSGLREYKQHADAYSVVSHKKRQQHAEGSFTFSGDLPGEAASSETYKIPDPNDARSRANDAIARAKEKAAAVRARVKGGRKFGQ